MPGNLQVAPHGWSYRFDTDSEIYHLRTVFILLPQIFGRYWRTVVNYINTVVQYVSYISWFAKMGFYRGWEVGESTQV